MQVWTAHEAGRTARVARADSRGIQVRVWDCMYGEVESFIRFVCVWSFILLSSKCVHVETGEYKAHVSGGDAGRAGAEEAGESICGTRIIRTKIACLDKMGQSGWSDNNTRIETNDWRGVDTFRYDTRRNN